jgi:hypothetical protein
MRERRDLDKLDPVSCSLLAHIDPGALDELINTAARWLLDRRELLERRQELLIDSPP